MTNTTLDAPQPQTTRRALTAERRTSLSFPRIVRSEWIKLRTLRSTVWSFGLIVLLTIGFGMLFAATFDTGGGPTPDVAGQNSVAVMAATLGVGFTQLVAAVLGVLIISGEYTTGMIRSTFAAVPARLPALFAKALVLTVTTFVVGLLSIVVTVLVTSPLLASKGIEADLLDVDVMRALLGGAGYLALIALLAFAFGAILRSSAGGIASALGLILVVPSVLGLLAMATQTEWMHNLSVFLPSEAGIRMYSLADAGVLGGAMPGTQDMLTLDATQGFLVMLGWVVVLLAGASVLVKRRDA